MALGGSTNAVLHLLAIANEARVDLAARRLQPGRRAGAAHRRHQAARQVPHDRHRPHRRRPGRDEGAARRRSAPRRLPHGHRARPSPRTWPSSTRRRPTARSSTRCRTRSTRSAASPCSPGSLAPKGAVVKIGRHRLRPLRGHRPRVRRRGRGDGGHPRRQDQRRRRRRHPLRGPQGRSGHARDAGRHRRHEGRRAAAATPRSSPTAGSRAAPTGSASATSRPRRSTAGRSRSWPRATASSSTSSPTPSTCWSTTAELERRRGEWKLPEPRYTTGVLAKYAALAQGAERGAITEA